MPAKKRRSLRKSYAGVLAPAPPRKKRTTRTTPTVTLALLKSGQETMREHAKVVVELSEALTTARAELAMKELQLDNFEGTIRALEEQSGFWQDEFQRLQDRLVLQIAEEARNRKPTAVED